MDPVSIVNGMFAVMSSQDVVAVGKAAATHLNGLSGNKKYDFSYKNDHGLLAKKKKKPTRFLGKTTGNDYWIAQPSHVCLTPRLLSLSLVLPWSDRGWIAKLSGLKDVAEGKLIIIGCKNDLGGRSVLVMKKVTGMTCDVHSVSYPDMMAAAKSLDFIQDFEPVAVSSDHHDVNGVYNNGAWHHENNHETLAKLRLKFGSEAVANAMKYGGCPHLGVLRAILLDSVVIKY